MWQRLLQIGIAAAAGWMHDQQHTTAVYLTYKPTGGAQWLVIYSKHGVNYMNKPHNREQGIALAVTQFVQTTLLLVTCGAHEHE